MNITMLNNSTIKPLETGVFFKIDEIEPAPLLGKNIYNVYIQTNLYDLIEKIFFGFRYTINNIVLMDGNKYLVVIETGD